MILFAEPSGRSACQYYILFIGNRLTTGVRFLPSAQKSITYYLLLYEENKIKNG